MKPHFAPFQTRSTGVNVFVNLNINFLVNVIKSVYKNLQVEFVIFGYVWKDPRAISEKAQRQYLADAGAAERFIQTEKSPARDWRDSLVGSDKPKLRKGDVLAVYNTQYLADDSLEFVTLLCRLAALGAGLHVVRYGVTIFPDSAMTEIIEQDIAERRKKQTENARKVLAKMPKRKGRAKVEDSWTDEQKKTFRKLWAQDPAKTTNRAIARHFDISAPAVASIAERMKLPLRRA